MKLEIWVNKDLLLPSARLSPLILHTTAPDTKPEAVFWNLLRDEFKDKVQIHWFHELNEAGSVVVTPNTLQSYLLAGKLDLVLRFNQQVLRSGRTPITFTGGIEYDPKPGEIIFATSTYKSKRETSIATPNWLSDLGNYISLIAKTDVPTIGFVGDTKYPGRLSNTVNAMPIPDAMVQWLGSSLAVNRRSALNVRQTIARLVRQKTICEVRKAHELKAHVIERSGGFFNATPEQRQRYRQEYLDNIQNNAYNVCVRGDENSSYRLYEVMSASRIPVIIDTGMQLPQLESMRWEEFGIIVPYADLHKIGAIVQAFHSKLSKEDFEQTCQKARKAFEALLPHTFIPTVLAKELKCAYINEYRS